MSRITKFAQSVLSGYFSIAAQTVYTFFSISLALKYLTKAEFGLWGLTMDIGAYITLIDAGMSGSISRVLIDHKDDPSSGNYGSIIKTGALVGLVQGLIFMLVGCAAAFSIGNLLHVPTELSHSFAWLMCGNSIALGFAFMTRIFVQILVAHQRYDIVNYSQSAVYILSLLGTWAGFAMGFGVLSLLAHPIINMVFHAMVSLVAVVRLRLLPASGSWGKVSGARFKELFNYGGALFIYSIGMQFITASQTILLTRFMSIESAGVWVVVTRVYGLLARLIWRTHEYSGPPLAEMFVRGELNRMRDRLRDTTYLTTNFAIFGALGLALCNNTFVQLWSHGKIQWHPINDLLLGLWLIVGTTMRAHVNLAGATKQFEFLCHVCFFEGFLFLALNIFMRNVDGMTRMLILSIACTVACSLIYSIRRTRRFFSLTWQDMIAWHRSTWRMTWPLALIGILTWMWTRDWQPIPRLATNATIALVFGGLFLLRYGFGKDLQNDIAGKLPPLLRRVMLAVRAA
jgi:O-antigen/teichoic acid export membrane protein